MKIQAAVLYDHNQPMKVETLDLAPPQAGEVLIRMGAAGVCHSDYHVISGQGGHAFPVVLGHEGAGEVLAVGDGVTRVAVGDHVVLSWIPYCGTCFHCSHDETHLCQTHKGPLWDGTMMDGTCRLSGKGGQVRHLSMLACWADHAVVPQDSCVVIPKDVPFDVAALLGCAVTTGVGAALNRAKVSKGARVVVMGAGGVGLSIIMGAKLAGAAQIIAVDASADAEAMARDLGATGFIRASDTVQDQVMAMTGGIGADYVFEAVGLPELQRACLDLARAGGHITYVGMAGNEATIALPTTGITRAEKTVTGSIFGSARTDRDFVAYAGHFLQGRLPIDRLIGRHYPLEQINSAIDDMLAGKAGRGVIEFRKGGSRPTRAPGAFSLAGRGMRPILDK